MIAAPPQAKITDAELEELGNKMAARMDRYRRSALHKCVAKGAPRWYALCSSRPHRG
jgi:hypothetical protein